MQMSHGSAEWQRVILGQTKCVLLSDQQDHPNMTRYYSRSWQSKWFDRHAL